VQRCIVVGDAMHTLADRVSAEGIECTVVSPGAPLATLLGRAADRLGALTALIDTARESRPQAASDVDPVPALTATTAKGTEPAVVSGDVAELHITFGARRWRIRGAERNKTPETLCVTDEHHGGFHLDTLDLCQTKARTAFIEAAAAELHTDAAGLRRELAEVLFATEAAIAARDASAGWRTERRRAIRTSPNASSKTSAPSGWWARRPTC
jgi:hypothetical protein